MNLLKNKQSYIISTAPISKNNYIKTYIAKKKDLMSYKERILYNTLLKICKELYLRICPKVRLADILEAQDIELRKKHMVCILILLFAILMVNQFC